MPPGEQLQTALVTSIAGRLRRHKNAGGRLSRNGHTVTVEDNPRVRQLIQDRAAAMHEILDLRREIERLRNVRSARKDRGEQPTSPTHAFRPGTLIRISDVWDLIGTSRSTIYRWVAEGNFPAPVRISEKAIRWKVDNIEAWPGAIKQPSFCNFSDPLALFTPD